MQEKRIAIFWYLSRYANGGYRICKKYSGIRNAHSTEMDPTCDEPVIDMMEEQKKITMKGGTMRLGSYACDIKEGTLAHRIYGKPQVSERHQSSL
mgnify:CR=1 FL=1